MVWNMQQVEEAEMNMALVVQLVDEVLLLEVQVVVDQLTLQ